MDYLFFLGLIVLFTITGMQQCDHDHELKLKCMDHPTHKYCKEMDEQNNQNNQNKQSEHKDV